MLKRLELAGFKSFADKTQFDFPAGITGIIGPNGSGKSNVVDAVRWVLGEQSAKSLRGGEMTDVIFNGAAGRRSLGLAEVTMTFDNSRHTLATEAEEVQICRRVYRSGESEYLINGHLCRLRDIKDLFLGSGAGTDAYSIIEQGRVDGLLQASTKDRRVIFEEAAGISRFKAKKTETLRRLERVEQNLQRLRDILDEVEKQLRSVKLQAAKAQRFQEYNDRLKLLRIDLGLKEYQKLSERLTSESAMLDELKSALDQHFAQAEAWEQELAELERQLGGLDASAREREAAALSARRQIDGARATLTHEWATVADLENDLRQTRQQLMRLNGLVTERAAAVAAAAVELREVEEQSQGHRLVVRERDKRLSEIEAHVGLVQKQLESDKENHMAQMRQAAHSQNDVVSFKAQFDNLSREKMRLLQRSEQAAEQMASLDLELQELIAADEEMQQRVTTTRQSLTDLRREREEMGRQRDQAAQAAADLRARRSGLISRIEVLENLERSHEGLGTGQREVLELLGQPKPGPWATVLGILADYLTVRREFAPLVDLALGEQAQRFLVEDEAQLAEALGGRSEPFSGRVSFLPLRGLAQATAGAAPAKLVDERVVALAHKVVRCDDVRLKSLPAWLLGKTLIVRDLAAARDLASLGLGYRCVTLQGELLEADGTLTVGTHHAEAGILSRKSELRELREQAVLLEAEIKTRSDELLEFKEHLAQMDGQLEARQRQIDVLAEQAADLRSRLSRHRQRREGLHEEVTVSRSEMTGIEQDLQRLQTQWDQAREKAAKAETLVQGLFNAVAAAEREIRERESERQRVQQEATAARVTLAQVEERLHAVQARYRQAESDLVQRRQEEDRGKQHRDTTLTRLSESERLLLDAYGVLALEYPRKEEAERLLIEIHAERDRLLAQKQQRAEQAHASRAAWRGQQEQAHAHELEAQILRHQREALCARLREDYQLELAELFEKRQQSSTPEPGAETPPVVAEAPADPVDEIEDLRRKLSKLGSVNLEALQELAELESRAGTLKIQFDDLSAAENRLKEIIQRINGDSRKLFSETFTAIRTHFQELFRKLFGGGMADIILEDDTDILESGIEIVARPPGKELRGISLMSGGEKTMTAVALLLAIFRSKPSPFCILDEVDAALDEANVGRFTSVLREFLDRSQFIIVTHSKRTMSCADVLYGVTMAESGISKRMSVRFEDWPDDERAKGDEPAA